MVGKPALLFEHGQVVPKEQSAEGCNVLHAHLHVVVAPPETFKSIVSAFDFEPSSGLRDLSRRPLTHGCLYVESADGRSARWRTTGWLGKLPISRAPGGQRVAVRESHG